MNFPEDLISKLEEAGIAAGFAIEKPEHAVPLAKALLAGGLNVIELMFRTEASLEALTAICNEVPEVITGVGTILTPEQAVQVKEAGADFGVSPGLNLNVVNKAKEIGLPFAPGICTPSEIEMAVENGCRFLKFFPAEPCGGVKYLKSMSAPYKHLGIKYFPLGGVNADNMLGYLAEPNVPILGGSWIVKKELLDNEDWDAITERAMEVSKKVKGLKV
jgi:2-dehydro-3-deoxyphosphogluconate aldolase/(4S)-4-hydroxy-2-oxoglutarate aldolase